MEKPNLEYLEQMSGGDKDFMQEIFDVLIEELPIEHDQYQKLIDRADYQEAAELVHKIKHKFIIVGLKDSYETAYVHENNLKLGKSDLHDDFLESINRVHNFIQEYNQ